MLLGCAITDKDNPAADKDGAKFTGSNMYLILLQADINSECYENLVILSKLIKLDEFPHPLTYSGDLKLTTAYIGLSGPSGTFSCPYCNGRRIGKKGEKKKWKLGKNQRTFQRLVQKHQQFMDPGGGKGDRKNKAASYENCVNMPIRLSKDSDNRPLIHELAPGPLHCMILGG